MNLTSDFPFWTVQNGLVCSYPALDRNLVCDVLVIGGGISGALVAYQFARKGIACVVIDRRDIGHGSTSASTALLQYEIDTPLYKLRKQVESRKADRAYLLGVEAVRQLGRLSGRDCGFAQRPSLQLAHSERSAADLEREFAIRRQLKLPVRLLDRRDLQRIGIQAVAALRSGIAAEVNPYLLTHRLLRRSRDLGTQVYDRTTSLHQTESRSGVTTLTDRGFSIKSKSIVYATGYEARDLLTDNIVSLKATYAFVSEPLQSLDWWKDRSLLWETGNPYTYMRTTSDRRILVGGKDDSVLDSKRWDGRITNKIPQLLRSFARVFPQKKIEPAFAWAGIFGQTKDGLAYIGKHPSFRHAYFALGFGGNGITFSQIASRIVVDLFLERRNKDASIFSFTR